MRRGLVGYGLAVQGKVRRGKDEIYKGCGRVWRGLAWHGAVRSGEARDERRNNQRSNAAISSDANFCAVASW